MFPQQNLAHKELRVALQKVKNKYSRLALYYISTLYDIALRTCIKK